MSDLGSSTMVKRDEDGELRCTRTGKRVATIDELSASYGRGLVRERLAAERAEAERQARMTPPGAQKAVPRLNSRPSRGGRRIGGVLK